MYFVKEGPWLENTWPFIVFCYLLFICFQLPFSDVIYLRNHSLHSTLTVQNFVFHFPLMQLVVSFFFPFLSNFLFFLRWRRAADTLLAFLLRTASNMVLFLQIRLVSPSILSSPFFFSTNSSKLSIYFFSDFRSVYVFAPYRLHQT